MGMEDVAEPEGAAMAKSMTIFFVSNVLIVYVLAHTLGVWRASAWGLSPDMSALSLSLALYTAGFTWLGFFLPLQMNRVAWEMKKWGLVAINAGFDLTRLLANSFILAYWGCRGPRSICPIGAPSSAERAARWPPRRPRAAVDLERAH